MKAKKVVIAYFCVFYFIQMVTKESSKVYAIVGSDPFIAFISSII